jgi:RNA polymerase sigma-70 factor (ECF subfamily)
MVTEEAEDARLIGRFLSLDGDQNDKRRAYEQLVARHGRFAGAVAYGVTGDFHASRDVVQEAFLKVYTGLGSLKEHDKFKGWLRNVVRTTALDWRRRNKKGLKSLDAIDLEADGDADHPTTEQAIEQVDDQEDLRRRVREEIERLPESHREVVALKYLDGKSYEEISALTGLSQATIESRLFRARQKLKNKFERVLGTRES